MPRCGPGTSRLLRGNLEALEVALGRLPASVEGVMLRTDGAGYQERIIRFCNDPSVRPERLRRFGTIALVTGAPRGLEVAEIGFASNMWARQKAGHVMRIVVTRQELVGERGLDNIPATGGRPVYRVRCDFTSIPAPGATAAELAGDLEPRDGEEIVRLAQERCGQGEAVHSMLKSDFAAGILPSGRIGSNAAWLQAAAITLNVVARLRMTAMGGEWRRARMKRLRAVWLHHVGIISRRGRRTTLFLPPAAQHLVRALDRLARSRAPP